MLTALHIENIAVIERADIEFAEGFNVLTGETGAGKSIVIDSLDAVLGGRTSRELVRFGAEKAMVSAVFSSEGAERWCAENEVDAEDGELILQRRITADGKSSCRVNGVPVSVSQLRELGGALLNIHGQNDGQQLMDEARHRAYLDSFGVDLKIIEEYTERYNELRTIKKEIKSLSFDDAEKERLVESLKYQIEELENAGLRVGEEAELEEKRELLKNSGKLTEAVDKAYESLYEADSSAIMMAEQAESALSRASSWSEKIEKAEKLITEARYILEDATEQLRDFRGTLDFSPEEYDALETRLALLRKLRKKYGRDEGALIEYVQECRVRLDDIEYAGDRIAKLESLLQEKEAEAVSAAAILSTERQKAAKELEKGIVSELRDLNMPSVLFKAEISPQGLDATGADEVRFLMSANAGEAPGRISKIASGGELSRIMLAMKKVFAEGDAVLSMVFDEIDAGVSGVAAQRVGEKMAELAGEKQVLCITHLPQIAALADTHFSIEKAEKNGRTYTSVRELNSDGRARELARLHGGDNITETTLISAKEQLASADDFKKKRGKTR